MAPSTQMEPAGTYNNVGVDYLSPKTSSGDIDVLTGAAGTSFFTFDCNNASIEVDTIEEFTAGSGVTVDGVLCKDGFPQGSAMAYFFGVQLGTSATNTTEFDIFKLDATDYPLQNLANSTKKNITYTAADGRFTFAQAGTYVFSLAVKALNNATNYVKYYQNGTEIGSYQVSNSAGAAVPTRGPLFIRPFSASDYLNVTIAPSSGDVKVYSGYDTSISIFRIF